MASHIFLKKIWLEYVVMKNPRMHAGPAGLFNPYWNFCNEFGRKPFSPLS